MNINLFFSWLVSNTYHISALFMDKTKSITSMNTNLFSVWFISNKYGVSSLFVDKTKFPYKHIWSLLCIWIYFLRDSFPTHMTYLHYSWIKLNSQTYFITSMNINWFSSWLVSYTYDIYVVRLHTHCTLCVRTKMPCYVFAPYRWSTVYYPPFR